MRAWKEHVRRFAELATLFGALIALDRLLLNGDAFAHIEPNPLWIPVLVLAMCYGTGMGLAAAAIASLIWIISPHEWPVGTDRIDEQYFLSLLPLLWTMTALLVGEVTARRKARYDGLCQRHEDLSADWERAALTFANLSNTNRDLQVRIASEQRVGAQALTVATGLTQLDPGSRMEALTKLIALAIQTEDFTYYQVRGDRFVAQMQGAAARGRPVDLAHTLLAQTISKHMRTIHVGQERGRNQLQDFGIAAIPVREEVNGGLAAVLVIHSADGLVLNAARTAEFSQLSRAMTGYATILARPPTINLVDCDFVEGRVA